MERAERDGELLTVNPHIDRTTARERIGLSRPCSQVFRLVLSPGLPLLEDTVKLVATYARSRFSQRVADRVALASQELLNNALDYCKVGHEVVFELSVGEDDVEVRVENAAIAERVDMLRKHLARIEQNPEGIFAEEVRRALDGRGARPMLGLSRIRAEAQMEVDVKVELNNVAVTATCRR